MADKTTFIKLDRNIINWRWFSSSKILSVFIWLIIKANIKEGHFQQDTIKRGSLATSNAHIAEGCGLTVSNVRTALADLESTGEISRVTRNHYQIITVNNYESYQSGISKTECPITSNLDGNSQATRNNQINKEYKNGRIYNKGHFAFDSLPQTIDEIVPERDLVGCPPFEEMPDPFAGSKRDIPKRVRHLFDGDYGAFWRYMKQCSTQ